MAKRIVFFADGTWNGAAADAAEDVEDVPTCTNVVKLYDDVMGNVRISTLRLQNEQEKELVNPDNEPLQVAKYIHGVGDSRNVLAKILGGTFGAGIIQRIVRGYTYVSRNYNRGDVVILIGFSRGAYTVRALGGMISRVGLLDRQRIDWDDKDQAYRVGLGAWTRYRRAARPSNGIGLLDYLDQYVAAKITDDMLVPDVQINAIGVWDTVGSLGIPLYAVDQQRRDVFQFADNVLSDHVSLGFHALSIDELRADFAPTRWAARQGVEERWFCGAHADIGGGYAETGLSDIALKWMREKLEVTGLLFNDPSRYTSHIDAQAQIHKPWEEPLWRAGKRYVRVLAPDDVLDDSVYKRLSVEANHYLPDALKSYLARTPTPGRGVA